MPSTTIPARSVPGVLAEINSGLGVDHDLDHALSAALDDLLRFDPVFASVVGCSAHDGIFGDHSDSGRRTRRRALAGHVHLLEGRPGATPESELDRRLLLDELQIVLRVEEDIDKARRDPSHYVYEVLNGLGALLSRPSPRQGVGALLGRLHRTSQLFAQAREVLEPAEVPAYFCHTAIAAARAGLSLLTEGLPAQIHALLGDGPLNGAVIAAAGEASLALGAFANFIEDKILPEAAGEYAAGESHFTFLLHKKNGVLLELDEIQAKGYREIARLHDELDGTRRQLRPTAPTWQEALRQLATEDAVPLDQLVPTAQSLCEEVRDAVRRTGLCPLPDDEMVSVQETPAYARPLVPLAAYLPPGILTGQGEDLLRGTLWLTPEARVGRRELLMTIVHEVYPGHHLLRCLLAQHRSRVRRVVGTPVFWRGWALYGESLVEDLGFDDALLKLYRLRAQIVAAYRLVIDVGLHCRAMSIEDAETQLREGAGLTAAQAAAEVRRCIARPTAATGASLGLDGFLHLRAEAERRGGFAMGAFHAEVLRHGSIPLGYLHERLGRDKA